MGFGMTRLASDPTQDPFTRFSTACGTGSEPREDGSSVAQRGREDGRDAAAAGPEVDDARRAAAVASILFVVVVDAVVDAVVAGGGCPIIRRRW
jgi:hypothetical protein